MKLSSQQLITTLIPRVPGLQLTQLQLVSQGLWIVFSATAPQVRCPICNSVTRALHSTYSRNLADLPWGGFAVRLQIKVRKFFCKLVQCPRRIFTERLPTLAAPYARRTTRFSTILNVLSFVLGARPAAKLAAHLSMSISPSTLLQLIRRAPRQQPPVTTPRIIGLDDFAFRKGQRYGTILVDLETRRPLDVLADRSAATVAEWLRQHPSIQVVSRDRSTEYTRAITLGAPQARQIADRFHIIKNLREALERLIDRNRRYLAGVVLPKLPRQPRCSVSVDKNDNPSIEPSHAGRKPAKRSPAETSGRAARQEQRQVRVARVRDLRSQGASINGIAQQLGINRQTVYRYLRSDTDPTTRLVRQKPSILDAHLAYLHMRWQEGCENGLQLWREVQEQGYEGSRKMVSVWVSQQRYQRQQSGQLPGQRLELKQGDEQDLAAEEVNLVLPNCKESSRSLSYFLLREPGTLDDGEQSVLKQMQEASTEIATGYRVFQDFVGMMRERNAEQLDSWIDMAKASRLPDLENFAAGIERDKPAVAGGLSEIWNNGQLEGQVNRLKLLKRSMYGRANFDLLRLRVLQVP